MNTYLVSEFVKDTAVSLEKSYRQLPPFDCEKSTVAVDFGGLYETHHDDALRDAELSEFACRYQAAYPDDKVFADHVADFGVNRDDPAESWGLQAVNVFNDRWQWDYRAAAGEYLRDFAELVGIPLHRINALLCKGNGDYSKTVPLPVLVAVATAIDYDLNEFKDLFLKGNQDV